MLTTANPIQVALYNSIVSYEQVRLEQALLTSSCATPGLPETANLNTAATIQIAIAAMIPSMIRRNCLAGSRLRSKATKEMAARPSVRNVSAKKAMSSCTRVVASSAYWILQLSILGKTGRRCVPASFELQRCSLKYPYVFQDPHERHSRQWRRWRSQQPVPTIRFCIPRDDVSRTYRRSNEQCIVKFEKPCPGPSLD